MGAFYGVEMIKLYHKSLRCGNRGKNLEESGRHTETSWWAPGSSAPTRPHDPPLQAEVRSPIREALISGTGPQRILEGPPTSEIQGVHTDGLHSRKPATIIPGPPWLVL